MASASDAQSSTNARSQGAPPGDLGDFFEKLDLHDDVVVEDEVPDLQEGVRWLALARVHTSKNFSQAAFFRDMIAAWNPA